VIVYGTRGRAVLEYPTDRLRLPGDTGLRQVAGRVSLLRNLLEHRADRAGVPLIAPLSRTLPFTAVLEAVGAAPEPVLLDHRRYEAVGDPPARVHVIGGVNRALRVAADRMALFSEVSVPWAVGPHVVVPGAGRVAHG
jgi:hypothetical protein